MKVSARNLIKGKVISVKEGAVMAKVTVEIGGGNNISSVITLESLKDLDMKIGDEVYTIIKSTEVILAKD
jgi:molybdopterin-binding protein